ncbi:MAG: hypothetical protein ACFFE8_14205 [Candidatus Heimdallarchaeota archaeon]
MAALTEVSTCNGCGAPLPYRPTTGQAVKCEYCDLTNYLKRSVAPAEVEQGLDEEIESEVYYRIYQTAQEILENFPGEYVGDEIGKLRIKMQVGQYAFTLLLVLDDLPDRPYIDGPAKLREILDCEMTELESMKEWRPEKSSVLDVLEEIHRRASIALPEVMGESPVPTAGVSPTERKEHDPLIQKILSNYDASFSKKEISVRFYAETGDVINFNIKRKKNYPIGLESEILAKYPLIRGPLEDYAKGRIDLLETLSEIERLLYV